LLVFSSLERLKEIQGSSKNQEGEEAKVVLDFATKFINSMVSHSYLSSFVERGTSTPKNFRLSISRISCSDKAIQQ